MKKNIFFTSDTHYNHKNIVRGVSSWDNFEQGSSHQSTRDFDTLEEHNETLISNFNQLVKPEDEVWHLGDVAFGGHASIGQFMERLNCKNINLIFGNHDQHIEKIDSPYRKYFKSCQYVKELSFNIHAANAGKYGKTKIFLSHFAHRVWNQSHHGTIHLFGHSHGSLPMFGVDTHGLYPYHLDEIMDIMKNVNWLQVDHHSENTN